MFKFKGPSKGVPQPTNLYFKYTETPWTFIGTFRSKYAAKIYAYEHGHMGSSYDVTWRIELTSESTAKQKYNNDRDAKLRNWVAQQWYNFYIEKYGEDCLK